MNYLITLSKEEIKDIDEQYEADVRKYEETTEGKNIIVEVEN